MGELTPGIAASEYADRRQRLAESLPRGCVAVFPSAAVAYMSHDVPLPYHQHADLFYLSGFAEPLSALACVVPAHGQAQWHLFVRPADPAQAMWDGPIAGVEGAAEHILPEGEVHPILEAASVLRAAVKRHGMRVLLAERQAATNLSVIAGMGEVLEAAAERGLGLRSVQPYVQELRVRKSAAEQALTRRSAQIAAASFRRTMASSRDRLADGSIEATLAAQFEFEAKLRGAERLAYPCVVAAGTNAVTLHYMHNNAPLRDGDLLLMDAGCSLHGYCSDITRTWPLGGRFSAAQRDVYAAVLDVNERCIDAVAAGGHSLSSLHALSMQLTHRHLVDLGIIRAGESTATARLQRYYPHALGHWLGIDVHDTPTISSSSKLEPGMVITVEPGLYFPAGDPLLPEWCRGIGVRIEDDVLIKEHGDIEVLTADAPKPVEAIEQAML